MMQTKERPKLSRSRRHEALMGLIGKLLGGFALVFMVASVFYVVMQRLWDANGQRSRYMEEIKDIHLQAAERSQLNRGTTPTPAKADELSAMPTPRVASTIVPEIPAVPRAVPVTMGAAGIDSKKADIEKSVRSFFEARTIDEMLAFVRNPDRIRPLMVDYYKRHQMPSFTWARIGDVNPIQEPGHRMAYVQAQFVGADPVYVIVEEDHQGEIRVDWESSVRYGEIAWKEFLQLKPDQPKLLRVLASRPSATAAADSYSNDEVLEIKHPEESGTVYAYFNRNDPQFATLIEQMKGRQWKNVPLTLRLCYPGSSDDGKVVRVAGVEGKGWLILQNTGS